MLPLVRYLREEHAHAFLERGEVLMRSLSYYRDYEDEGVRADQLEGTLAHRPKDGLPVQIVATGERVSLPYTFESTAREHDIFVYCLSTELSSSIASRFRTPVAIEIVESVQFVARLRSALGLRKRFQAKQLVHGHVRYYELHEPPIVDWALPERIALRKPKHFEWQHEYRFAVPSNSAFALGNVEVRLVPLGAPRPARASLHGQQTLKLGSLRKLCRVHRF